MKQANNNTMKKWEIWIDTGGTFTDCIALSPSRETIRSKVLSSSRLRGNIVEKIAPKTFRFSHNGAFKPIFFKDILFI
jgi:5-oxoprolinase (ATP-hydrolysing)